MVIIWKKVIGFRRLASLYSAILVFIIGHHHKLCAYLLNDAILLDVEKLLIEYSGQHVLHGSFGRQFARLGSQIKRVLLPNRVTKFECDQLK